MGWRGCVVWISFVRPFMLKRSVFCHENRSKSKVSAILEEKRMCVSVSVE